MTFSGATRRDRASAADFPRYERECQADARMPQVGSACVFSQFIFCIRRSLGRMLKGNAFRASIRQRKKVNSDSGRPAARQAGDGDGQTSRELPSGGGDQIAVLAGPKHRSRSRGAAHAAQAPVGAGADETVGARVTGQRFPREPRGRGDRAERNLESSRLANRAPHLRNSTCGAAADGPRYVAQQPGQQQVG